MSCKGSFLAMFSAKRFEHCLVKKTILPLLTRDTAIVLSFTSKNGISIAPWLDYVKAFI